MAEMQSEVKKILGEKIASLLLDEDLEEIMVIGDGSPVYVYDKKKGTVAIDMVLRESEIKKIIQKIAEFSGRIVNDSDPLLDARLPDGSRVNATLSTVTPRGSTVTIRKFRREPLTIADLIRYKTVSPKLAAFLWVAVEGLRTKPANILILGGAATGKTTTLNALSYFIPANERIISIEDTMEVSLKHRHWIPMETRPPSTGTKNEVTMDALLKNALRMRPDRIIVGEVRGEEALTLFAAMNTGHDGCTATIHANSAREGLARLQNHPMNVPDIMIPVLDIIIAQKKQMEKGKLIRRVFEVAEISGREGGNILTNTLFEYNPRTDALEVKILNGRIIQELAKLTNLTVREIDEEIEKREAILDTLAKSNLEQDELHELIQLYYRNPEEAIEQLYEKVKT
ncbi:MAG: ATPase, T2SS/T4P/T4SS family [Candidatus Hydrothermarchaeota archaeon]|nr:ATPase, T2SS/T4P/T4SS family [Candidatus Hydrothermarchaeota archaeon]